MTSGDSHDGDGLPAPPRISSAEGPVLARRLIDAGFGPALFEQVGETAAGQLDPLRMPVVRETLARDGSPGALLLLALGYGGPPPTKDALGEHGALVDDLSAAGLLGGLRVIPFAEMFIVADDSAGGRDAVMPPGGITANLVRVFPPCADKRVLDLGGGPGTLALFAAKEGAARAVSTDINPRTPAFVDANAALAGVTVDARVGDLYEPVAGERFDLVVSQPPFIALPPASSAVTYLHGGSRGDELALRMIAGLDDALDNDGIAVLRFDAAREPHDLVDAVRAIDAPDRQTIVLWWPGLTVETFAVAYAAMEDRTLGARYATLAAAYREHLQAFGLERLVSALVVTRRITAPAPSFLVGFGTSACPQRWDDIDVALASFELSMRPDDDLRVAHVRPHPDLQIDERRTPGFDDAQARAHLPHGTIGWRASLEPDAVVLVDLVASTPHVDDIITRFARGLDLDDAAATDLVLPRIRAALQKGLLVAEVE